MHAAASYQIVFPDWYDQRGEWEAREKGWLKGVEIRFANGNARPLFFYDLTRLAQDLDAEIKQGRPYIAQPGMVVIPEVTREAILVAVDRIVDDDSLLLSPKVLDER